MYLPDIHTYKSEYSADWAKHFLDVVVGNDKTRIEYRPTHWDNGTAWARRWSERNIVCMHKAAMVGAFGFVVCTLR